MSQKKKLSASLEGLFSKSDQETESQLDTANSELVASESTEMVSTVKNKKAVVQVDAPTGQGKMQLATRGKDIASTVNEKQLVVFSLANEHYGVDITVVESIIRMEPVTIVPHAPAFIEGVINMRGEILPVIDLGKRFGLPLGKETKETRIIVAEVADRRLGMVVDAVTEVLHVSEDIIEPPSALVTALDTAFINGIAKIPDRLVILLDLEKILAADDKAEPGSLPTAT